MEHIARSAVSWNKVTKLRSKSSVLFNRIANSGVAHLKLNNIIINSILLCFNKYYQVLEIDRNRLEASYEWRDLRPCLGFLQSG